MNKGDVSDIIAIAMKRHNEDWLEVIEEIAKKLQFQRGLDFNSPFHQLESDHVFTEKDENTGRLSRIIFRRRSRETTESEWKETRLEMVPSPQWNGKFSFQCLWLDQPVKGYAHDYMDFLTFFGSFIQKLKTFFRSDKESV